uniref:Uncharacterized protein n=1 Tax=Siphoviridae sp. ct3z32 TaxID=2825327 RepID=A0A8S5VHT3_9CAUD|nr:MAG TPA: hypothetical protein [Siphoviridae sp. ct3z32]
MRHGLLYYLICTILIIFIVFILLGVVFAVFSAAMYVN